MLKCLSRTVIIYILLILAIRTTGKRQIGELEISELVSTLLISEIASLPIGNNETPMFYAIVPTIAIVLLEILLTFLNTRSPLMKKILLGSPVILIKKGKLQQNELSKARMSVEELLSELRQNGITSIEDVGYAILEINGKLSVIPKASSRPLETGDIRIPVSESGIAHAIIIDGVIKEEALEGSGLSKKRLMQEVERSKLDTRQIFLMTVDDAGKINIIKKDN